jgi:hypothetical protein
MKKLKVNTITCHDVYNFGASLQAYALMKYLEDLGHEVQIIDYKSDYLSYNIWAIGEKWDKNIMMKFIYYCYVIPKRIGMKKRRERFDQFTSEQLNLTAQSYSTFSKLEDNPPIADVYFAGSDQIWNPLLPNGKDRSFYLDFVPAGKVRASYAASFSVNEIAEELQPFVKTMLAKLDFISVRETSGVELVRSLGFEDVKAVFDPVYLLPKNAWKQLSLAPKIKDKYIFVYDQENNALLREAAVYLAKKYKFKIVAIEALYPLRYADIKIKDAGPREFLGLIENCEICLTNSFHCISFSLIFNKNFYLFKRTHLKVNSRMIDLLHNLGLSNRIIESFDGKWQTEEIEYREVNNKVEIGRTSSCKYIQEVLESVK